jgi:hypothetical protein
MEIGKHFPILLPSKVLEIIYHSKIPNFGDIITSKTKMNSMRFFSIMLFAVSCFFLVSCGGETTTTSSSTTDTTETTTDDPSTTDTYDQVDTEPITHDCAIKNETLEDNQVWVRERNKLVVITADSSTLDPDYGPSHRVVEVYNTEDCSLISRNVLPINISPDFPYYLAKISYSNATGFVAIKGFGDIILYDLENDKLLSAIKPSFRYERMADDAQSGMIQRVEVWENYLIGFAQDMGSFAFDLSDRANPKAVLAEAEFKAEEGFSSLFMLPTADNKFQILIPEYNSDEDQFAINPMLEEPKEISNQIVDGARNNRHLVLREKNTERTPYAFDLQTQTKVDLPSDVAKKGTKAILDFVKKQ